jgi:hypothetical protein
LHQQFNSGMMLKSLSLAAATLFMTLGSVKGQSGLQPNSNMRQPAGVSYQARINCPALCSLSGPTPTNWTALHSIDQVVNCQETVFYHFSIHDSVDDNTTPHRIYACTSYGSPQKAGAPSAVAQSVVETLPNATFTLGAWNWTDSTIRSQNTTLSALSQQMRLMLDAGFTNDPKTSLVLFAQSLSGTAGLYLGKGVQVQQTASKVLSAYESWLKYSNVIGASAALQLCQKGYDGDHVFGFIATSNTSFVPVQQALQSWSNATCLTFDTSVDLVGTASFTTPLVGAVATTSRLARRSDCTTVQVASGDGCGSLA